MGLKFPRSSWPLSPINSTNIFFFDRWRLIRVFFFLAKKQKHALFKNNVRDVFISTCNFLLESITAPDESSIVSFHFAILYHMQQPYYAWAACRISWPSFYFFFARACENYGGETTREFQNVSSSFLRWAALQLLCQNSVHACDPANYAGCRLWRKKKTAGMWQLNNLFLFFTWEIEKSKTVFKI